MTWDGKHGSVRDAARLLQVGTVLEGSVQRDGERVRINVQLIDAVTDSHLWAEVYDRSVANSFAVQSEIAAEIAKQLRLVLTSSQRESLDQPPTANPRAYEQLMIARALTGDQARIADAVAALQAAVVRDPDSAVLQAELGNSLLRLSNQVVGHQAATTDAQHALDRALALDPSRPEVQLAQAHYQYRVVQDNARAVAIALPALAALPNEANGRVVTGWKNGKFRALLVRKGVDIGNDPYDARKQ